jgi:hypothetical protein
MNYTALDRARIIVEAYDEWYLIEGIKPVFKEWLLMQGIDINGDRVEGKLCK